MESIGKAATSVMQRSSQLPTSGLTTTADLLAKTSKLVRIVVSWADPAETGDPGDFFDSITLVMSGFPLDVQQRVADPRLGLITKKRLALKAQGTWVSFVDAVRMACEEEHLPILRRLEYERRSAQQLAEREEYERIRAAAPVLLPR